jgi:2-succinyl-5-enolpyruvyl-6-hydroxy-3-cyclohexene-1-carboxylate synthase
MYDDPTYTGLEAFVAELVHAGVEHACVMPGARSTPLALMLATQPGLHAWSHIDERSGAFFALGIAKVTRRPVVVVCTSGTAAANLLPAAIEAFYAHVPLLLLTADRPPELRDCGAPQTIDQIKLYGTHVKWFAEVGTADAGLRYFRTLACQAVARACATPPGPVHLNFPFREPLMPASGPPPVEETVDKREPHPSRRSQNPSTRREKSAPAQEGPPQGERKLFFEDNNRTARPEEPHAFGGVSKGARWRESTLSETEGASAADGPLGPLTPVANAIAFPPEHTVQTLAVALAATSRGLIACGPQDCGDDFPAAVAGLAKLIGYPVLADPASQVRSGAHDTSLVIDAYDAVFRDGVSAHGLAPEVVLRFGPLPTSKAFAAFLQQHPSCRHIVVDPLAPWSDPTSSAAELLPWDPVATCAALRRHLGDIIDRSGNHWQTEWLRAARRVRQAIEAQLDALNELFEGKVFAELARLLPDGACLYAGNSMPIRDLETFWPVGSRHIRFLCNRGANGIDGFISSGLGAAAVSEHPLVIVAGDLAFYHDLNGLLAAKRHGLRATIIVINNDGGGIFSFLPQGGCGDQVAEYFFTPHGLDFRGAAEMYGCVFTRVASWEQFRSAVSASLSQRQTTVIEVPSDRQRNLELHQRIWARAADALRDCP